MSTEDRLYRDLTYTQLEALTSEQVYPYWENVFAVIVGAFFVVFFQSQKEFERTILALIGFIFCLSWFRLVCRNRLFSRARTDRKKRLEEALNHIVTSGKKKSQTTDSPIDLFMLYKDIGDFIDRDPKWSDKKGTWKIRVSLTGWLASIWFVLILYSGYLWLCPMVFGKSP